MSFSFISKISLFLSFIFIISCQGTISSSRNDQNIDSDDYNFQLETEESLDFNVYEDYQNDVLDNYTYLASDYNFLDKDLAVLKINNYEAKYNNNNDSINLVYLDESIYSINKNGELLKFNLNNGKLINDVDTKTLLKIENSNYISKMKKEKTWGGGIEIQCACNIWNLKIIVLNIRDNAKIF